MDRNLPPLQSATLGSTLVLDLYGKSATAHNRNMSFATVTYINKPILAMASKINTDFSIIHLLHNSSVISQLDFHGSNNEP